MESRLNPLQVHAARTAMFPYIDWDSISESTILVTGATGLIGSHIVRTLIAANDIFGLNLSVVAAVRNADKFSRAFRAAGPSLRPYIWDGKNPLEPDCTIDFMVHAASPTTSRAFVEYPVETIKSIVSSGYSVFDLCMRDKCRLVFLSSMEVYGRACCRVDETFGGDFDSMRIRSSYPEAKRLVECLCASYVSEYAVKANVIRLAQTFGQGVNRDDNRVFAEFGRCAQRGEDIVLVTDGLKRNPYLSVDDAVGAIMCVMLSGESGVSYNAANELTYCSVREMAAMVLEKFGHGSEKLIIGAESGASQLYRELSEIDMDCSKLNALGWFAADSLADMYTAMFESWNSLS